MNKRTKVIIGGAAVVVALAGGSTMAVARGGDDDAADAPIPAGALDRASNAALKHTGGGRVTETEVGDEESYYEVEVTLDNGGQVDVQLDKAFKVVGAKADGPAKDDVGNSDH